MRNLKIYLKGFFKGSMFLVVFVLLAIPTEFNATYKKFYEESYTFNILGWFGGVAISYYLAYKHNQLKAWIFASFLLGILILPLLLGNIELNKEKLKLK